MFSLDRLASAWSTSELLSASSSIERESYISIYICNIYFILIAASLFTCMDPHQPGLLTYTIVSAIISQSPNYFQGSNLICDLTLARVPFFAILLSPLISYYHRYYWTLDLFQINQFIVGKAYKHICYSTYIVVDYRFQQILILDTMVTLSPMLLAIRFIPDKSIQSG